MGKDKNLNIRVEHELFEEYYKLCIENDTTISAELRGLMSNSVGSGTIIDTAVKKVVNTDFRDSLGASLHNVPAQW